MLVILTAKSVSSGWGADVIYLETHELFAATNCTNYHVCCEERWEGGVSTIKYLEQ